MTLLPSYDIPRFGLLIDSNSPILIIIPLKLKKWEIPLRVVNKARPLKKRPQVKKIPKEIKTQRIPNVPTLHLIQRWQMSLWMRRSQPLEKASMNILLNLLLLSLGFVLLLFSFFFMFSPSYILPFPILQASPRSAFQVKAKIDMPLDLSFLDQTTPFLKSLVRPLSDSNVTVTRSIVSHFLSLDILSLSPIQKDNFCVALAMLE